MIVRQLLHLLSVRYSDLSVLPEGAPQSYGTIQVYSAVFDALLDGMSKLFVKDNCIWMANPKKPGGRYVSVPFRGGKAYQLVEQLMDIDPLFGELFDAHPRFEAGAMVLILKNPEPITWQDLKDAREEITNRLADDKKLNPNTQKEIERDVIESLVTKIR